VNVADVTPQEVVIKLESGRELHLSDLTLLDYRDGEKRIGRSHGRWLPSKSNADTWEYSIIEAFAVVLWLAARKHGVTKQDQLAGKWALSLEDLIQEATGEDLVRHLELVVSFYDGRRAKKSSGSSPAPSSPDSPTATS